MKTYKELETEIGEICNKHFDMEQESCGCPNCPLFIGCHIQRCKNESDQDYSKRFYDGLVTSYYAHLTELN